MSGRRLENRVALVTGSSKGIGRGCALCLAEAGADVVLNCRPSGLAAGRNVLREIEQLGRRAALVAQDLGDEGGVDKLFDEALARFDRFDIVVSNVAYEVHQGILDISPADVRRTFDVTLTAAMRLAQLAARHMVDRGRGGKIIFITSIHGEVPFAGAVAYNVAKAGLNHLVQTMAHELAPYRINVNGIAPGWIDTPGERRWKSGEELARLGAKLPWGRMGTPEDIGRAVAFLASDDADYITGSILKVDGGFTASLGLHLE